MSNATRDLGFRPRAPRILKKGGLIPEFIDAPITAEVYEIRSNDPLKAVLDSEREIAIYLDDGSVRWLPVGDLRYCARDAASGLPIWHSCTAVPRVAGQSFDRKRSYLATGQALTPKTWHIADKVFKSKAEAEQFYISRNERQKPIFKN